MANALKMLEYFLLNTSSNTVFMVNEFKLIYPYVENKALGDVVAQNKYVKILSCF